MKDPSHGEGTIQVLLLRLNQVWIPRALELKGRVDAGARLDEFDIAFLKRVFRATQQASTLVAVHPELRQLAEEVTQLYDDITRRALDNERSD